MVVTGMKVNVKTHVKVQQYHNLLKFLLEKLNLQCQKVNV